MGKKNKRSDGLVYSSGPSPIDWSDKQEQDATGGPREAVVRIEKKGRGGKAVTVIELRGVSADEAKTIGKSLKNACGVGGTTKGSTVEIQGDQRDRLRDLLEQEELKVKGI